MKILMFIILFLLIGAFFIISNQNLKLGEKQNIQTFLTLYSEWFDQLITNSKTASGYAIKMKWLPNQGKI